MADIILAVIACQPANVPAYTPFRATQARIGGRSCARGSERKNIERTVSRRLHDLLTQAQPDVGRLFIERASESYNPSSERTPAAWFIDYLTPAATAAYEQFVAERADLDPTDRTAAAALFNAKAQWGLDQLPKAPLKGSEPNEVGDLMAIADYTGLRLRQIEDSVERTVGRINDVYAKYDETARLEAIHFVEELRARLLKRENSLRKATIRDHSERSRLRRAQILAEGDDAVEIDKVVNNHPDNPGLGAAPLKGIFEEFDDDFEAEHPDKLSGRQPGKPTEDSTLQEPIVQVVEIGSVSRAEWLERYRASGFSLVANHYVKPDGTCSCWKEGDCPSIGKHPVLKQWEQLALTDKHGGYRRLYQLHDENVGVAAGMPSGVIALDFDGEDGKELYSQLTHAGWLPETLTQRTGSGGLHALLKYFPGLKNGVKVVSGLDLRTDGGQVIVEPSRNRAGAYRWINWGVPIAEATPELRSFLLTHACKDKPTQPGESGARYISSGVWEYRGGVILCGERNDRLFRLACSMRGDCGMNESEILVELEKLRAHYCEAGSHPVADSELRSIAHSVVSRYPAEVQNAA